MRKINCRSLKHLGSAAAPPPVFLDKPFFNDERRPAVRHELSELMDANQGLKPIVIAIVPSFDTWQQGVTGVEEPAPYEPASDMCYRLLAAGDQFQGLRIALLGPSFGSKIASGAAFDACIHNGLAQVMRLQPDDPMSPPLCTSLWVTGHGRPGYIDFNEDESISIFALAQRTIDSLPPDLRAFVRHIHLDSCSSLGSDLTGDFRRLPATAAAKQIVFTGYVDKLWNVASIPIDLLVIHAISIKMQQVALSDHVTSHSTQRQWSLAIGVALV